MIASPENEKTLRDLLSYYDPLGVDERTDEYIVIAHIILARLKDVSTFGQLEDVLDESFGMWVEEDTPELVRQCGRVAVDFWKIAQN